MESALATKGDYHVLRSQQRAKLAAEIAHNKELQLARSKAITPQSGDLSHVVQTGIASSIFDSSLALETCFGPVAVVGISEFDCAIVLHVLFCVNFPTSCVST
jgi:hypothetical protein